MCVVYIYFDSPNRIYFWFSGLGVPLIAPKSKAIFYGYLGGFVNLSCAVIHEGNTTNFTWTRKENNSLHQQSITTFDDKFISTIQVDYMIVLFIQLILIQPFLFFLIRF